MLKEVKKWYHSTGEEIDFLTSSAGYTQIIDKPTYAIYNSKLCINLIFSTNQNVSSKYGVDASLFNKKYYLWQDKHSCTTPISLCLWSLEL